jgi:FkbM family methyltransferase
MISTARWHGILRNRLKYSSIRRLYWAVAKKETLISSQREQDFYHRLLVGLRHDDLVFDVGANQGAKTDIFLRLGARVVAVEPDEACHAILQDRFLRYRLKTQPVTLVGKAVSDGVGSVEMYIDGPASALNTISPKWANYLRDNREHFEWQHCGLTFSRSKSVETTTVEELVNLYGPPFFVKIDVEGHELNVLRGIRRPVPFLSYEINMRAFKDEGVQCVRILSKLKSDGCFNYTPDCSSGLVLKEWLGPDEFCAVLESCTDETVEVFWRSGSSIVSSEGRA